LKRRNAAPRAAVESTMLLTFLENNWWLVLVLVVSGAMLIWPALQFRLGPVREVGAIQATQLINRQNALMLDVRETQEYEGGRVPHAVHLPLSQLAGRGAELKKFTSRPVIAYCDRGSRSRSAAGKLAKLGFAEVYTLRGGLRAWSEAGLPVEKQG
jgi:rhodanese-related sulfurtransferase